MPTHIPAPPSAAVFETDPQGLDALILGLETRFDAADPDTRTQVLAEIAALIARHRGDGVPPPVQLCDLQRRLAQAVIDDSFDNMPV